MKLLARDDRERPQDLDDLRALIPTLDARERARVDAALAMIERRGYARGRDLVAAWHELVPPRRKVPSARASSSRRTHRPPRRRR